MFVKLGELVEAEVSLKTAVRHAPGSAALMDTLGALYAQWQRHDTAVEWYSRALEVDPDHLSALRNAAVSMQRMRRFDTAREYLERVRTPTPLSADARHTPQSSQRLLPLPSRVVRALLRELCV